MNSRITVSEADWFVCAWCHRPLPQQQGQPRGDLMRGFRSNPFEFVCADGCSRAGSADAALRVATTGGIHDRSHAYTA